MSQLKLTPKQEKFAQAYVKTSNASESYRQAYEASKMKPDSINVNASKLLADAKVALRVSELRAELAKQELWTREDSVKVLKAIAQGKDQEAKPSDRVSAVKALNSMHGWDKQVVDVTSSDGSMTPKDTSSAVIAAIEAKYGAKPSSNS